MNRIVYYDCCIQYEKVVGILNLVLKSYNFPTTFLLKMAEVERANNSKNNNKNKKNAFVFSDEEVEMLISEWGKREVLFDSKNPFYFNKDGL